MKKRITSILLVVIMIACLLPMSVSAAELTYARVTNGDGWQLQTKPSSTDTAYAFTIANEGHESERSWHITYVPAEGETSGVGMRLQLPTGTYEMNGNTTVVSGAKIQTVGKYKLSFWVKIVKGSDGIIYGPAWNWQGQSIFDAPHKVTANSEWQKVEATGNFTGSGANQNMNFSIKGATEKDFYIDDISLVRIADDGTEISPNLLTPELGSFDVAECEREETDNGGLNTVTDWGFSKSTTGGSKWGGHISTADAKDSNASMRLRWHPDIATVNNDNVSYRLQLPDMESGKLDTMGTYTLSFWCKRVKGTSLKFVGPWNWTPLNIADYVPTLGTWTKVEITKDLTTLDNGSATKNMQFVLQGKDDTEVFIDKISIKDANGKEYTGIMQREFEEIDESEIPDEPDVPDAKKIPDLTGEYFTNSAWGVTQAPADEETYYLKEVSAKEGHNSMRSLHFIFNKSANETQNLSYRFHLPDSSYTDSATRITTTVSGTKIQEKGKYKVSFWVKVVSGCADFGFTPPWSWSGYLFKNIGVSANGEWTKVEKTGELTAEVSNGGAATRNMCFIVKGEGYNELYVDDISIVRIDDNGNEISPNLFPGAAGDFETVTDGIEGFGTRFFDEEYNEITCLTPELSGQKIKALAAALSHNETTNGRIVIGVYENDMLKSVEFSDSVIIEGGKNAVDIPMDVQLPEYDNPENIKIKAFIWNGTSAVKPIGEMKVYDDEGEQSVNVGNVVIFGDSISTFNGYIPEGYGASYNNTGGSCTDVTNVKETWWRRIIDTDSANKLLFNSSWGGTTVCHTGYNGADVAHNSFVTRAKELIDSGYFEENKVDTIFIFGGTNDMWAGVPVGEPMYKGWTTDDLYSSVPAFCYLIDSLKKASPDSRIVCLIGIALDGKLEEGYIDACEYYGVEVVDLVDIDTFEGHPTVKGMGEIKDQVIAKMNEK